MSELLRQLPVPRRWQQQFHPVPSVLALVCRNTPQGPAYLLIQRVKPPYLGKWALIGGKWDFGETLSQAVIREVKEETGLMTQFVAMRSLVNERLVPQRQIDSGAHFILFVCEVQAPQGEPSEQTEGPVAWFDASQLENLHLNQQIAPTDYLILKHCRQGMVALPYVEAEVAVSDNDSLANRVVCFETTG